MDTKLDSAPFLVAATVGVFAASKEVVEGNVGKVTGGLLLGIGGFVGKVSMVVSHGDRNG